MPWHFTYVFACGSTLHISMQTTLHSGLGTESNTHGCEKFATFDK